MKRSFIPCLIILMAIVSNVSAAEFGPPEPLADTGKFSLGLGYGIDRDKMKQGDDRLGAKSHEYYVQGSYTFLKDWEVNGALGGADERLYDRDLQVRSTDGGKLFGSLGTKGVLYRNGSFALGPFLQGSLYADHSGVTKNEWDLNLGVSAQYAIKAGDRNLTVYGGPFAYVHRADSDTGMINPQDDIQERGNVGGFLGIRVPVVSQKLFLTAETELKERIGGALSLGYKF
ncbi:MAG TPA: hypothetical protein VMT62_15025 [Syntrophorhabdaceae bacterium]|nr:hypothetical protein [Syntrophorhabdaceae bacterium]